MSKHNSRREFLKQCGVATSYLCALPTTLRTHAHQAAGTANIFASTTSLVADLQTLIPALMNRNRVPGLSIALIRDAQIIWRQGFGLKNVTTKEPVTPETIFEAASLSKPTFAYAALKMQ